jgi:hypothetical protein
MAPTAAHIFWWSFALGSAVVCAIGGNRLAERKSRNIVLWTMLCFVFSWVGLAVLALLTNPAVAKLSKCQVCGRAPAAHLVIRRHVGMVVIQKWYKLKGYFCRDCGLKLLHDYTFRTVLEGWWGIISFFVNWLVLLANGFFWLRCRRLPQALPVAAADAPQPGPQVAATAAPQPGRRAA